MRTTVYILLPLSIVLALVLVSQGVRADLRQVRDRRRSSQPVTYDNPKNGPDGQPLKDDKGNPVTEKATATEQTIPLGPAASQIAIKQLGTNGGGFFNVNSAHPFENPTPLSNFLEMLAILLIPAALCYTFGKMVGDTRQGWALLAAMTIVFVALLRRADLRSCERRGQSGCWTEGSPRDYALSAGNPSASSASTSRERQSRRQHGRQGGALRRRQLGAVGGRHDLRVERLGQLDARLVHAARRHGPDVADAARRGDLRRRRLGPVRHDHVRASSPCSSPGLMIGRTPEYLGKKIGAFEMKMASIAILLPPLLVLCGTAIAVMVDAGKAGVANPGEHGFSEILYAFSSASNNNGSAFAGLSANTPFYNTALGICMLFARYWLAIPGAGARRRVRRREARAAVRRHAADAHAAVRRAC